MRWALALAVSALVCGPLCAATPTTAKAKTTAKTPNHKATASSKSAATGRKSTGVRTVSTARGRAVRGKHGVRVAAGPAIQAHPETERYQQIQQALADKGYYKGEVNGEWNPDSIDAMKHFQADQKLEPDGKINSWSLIGLGLGPKHDGSSVATSSIVPTAPAVQPAPQASIQQPN